MSINQIKVLLLTIASLAFGACSTESNQEDTPTIPYTEIDSTSGFTSEYLDGKSFFRPENYSGNDFIYTYQFSNGNVFWNDNLFMGNGTAPYSIVTHNGIQGILQYNDGAYDLFYNIHSVASDHLKLCYTYTGIDTVINCDESATLKWYFDKATAELNYP